MVAPRRGTRYRSSPSGLFESFGEGKRVKIPRGPRHCHRGRLGRQTTGRERSATPVARSGRSPQAEDPEARRPAGRHASRTGPSRDAPSNSRGAGRCSNRPRQPSLEREVRMATLTPVLLVFLGALSRLVPHPPNFVAMGALALYSGARLPRRRAWAVPFLAMAVSDFFLDFGSGRAVISVVRVTIYATFAVIVFAGRSLRAGAGAGRLAAFSAGASLLFFLTSNFAEWLADPKYPKTPAGLALCYVAGIPFFGSTLAADLLGTATLFGLDALARRERLRALAAAFLLAALAAPALGQDSPQIPPASAEIVVTATSVPENEKDVGSAITVVTREELEKNEIVVVSDVLLSVPGLAVTQSGTPAALTSLFTDGHNPTQPPDLIDRLGIK